MGMLISNLRRCQIQPSAAANVGSKILAEKIPQTANLVIVETPCTGQSLLAKGNKAPGFFHHVTINTNPNRQKRILANSAQIVAPQGSLAYMTCTYSTAENEQVSEWLLSKFPEFQPVTVAHLEKYRSHLTEFLAIGCARKIDSEQELSAFGFKMPRRETNQLPADFLALARFTNL